MTAPSPESRSDTLVSVVIPAFNYGRFLPETLRSLQAQSHGNWEAIVVDDGSTDETPDVVAHFSSIDLRIRYARQPNRGQPAARNHALRMARGEYVQLLDADDLIESDKLRRQVQFLESRSEVDIVYGDVRYFPTDRPQERRHSLVGLDVPWMPCISGAGTEVIRVLAERNIMVINSPLTRRRALDDVGPFDESLPRADDWDMWVRCALAGKRFEYRDLPGTLALVRSHATSLTKRDRRLLSSSITIRRKIGAAATIDDATRAANDAAIEWSEQVSRLARVIDSAIPSSSRFILIDDEKVRPELLGYEVIPFTEHDGSYWGPPADSAHAIGELARLRSASGAQFCCIAWTAAWYADLYPRFVEHLNAQHKCVARTQDVTVYQLR